MVFTGYRPNDKLRRFTPLPNAIFNLDLCAGEIAIYAYLMYCENRKTYQCYPSYRTIGNAVGLTRNTVKKYVDSLVDKGLIYTEPTSIFTKAGKKQNGSLMYTSCTLSAIIRSNSKKGASLWQALLFKTFMTVTLMERELQLTNWI